MDVRWRRREFAELLADRARPARRAALPRTGRSDRRRDRHRVARRQKSLVVRQRRQRGRSAAYGGRTVRHDICANAPGLHSEALSVNSSTLTCIGNDYGYEGVFARQVEAFAHPGDVVIGMTTSGTSRNIVPRSKRRKRAARRRSRLPATAAARSRPIADLVLIGPDGYAAIVQEVHQVMAHIVCDLVEQRLIFEDGIA